LSRPTRSAGPIPIPADATEVLLEGPRPFVTHVRYRAADGSAVEWEARRHRRTGRGQRNLTWVIGLLFVIGSACFIIGPIPAYAQAVGAVADAATFFVGSLFFTTAAYLSYMQVVRRGGRRWVGWEPTAMGFWATLIQFFGTLFFNVTTLAALLANYREPAEAHIWRPDAIGSICFLVSSAIAFAEAGHRWFSWRPGERDWHITALNWWGSLFFGISAIGAYTLPDGDLVSLRWDNVGTILGGVCFFVASILMMPEGRDEPARAAIRPALP
jgi:hypothetical protein